jgi:hypothetical protein
VQLVQPVREIGVVDVGRPVEPPPRLREGRDRQAVPRGDDLVVTRRLGPLVAELEELRAQLWIELAANHASAVLEWLKELRRHTFVLRPGVRQPLDAVGVSVLRGGEAATLDRELAQHVVERLLDELAVARLAEHEPAVQVRRRQ